MFWGNTHFKGCHDGGGVAPGDVHQFGCARTGTAAVVE